MKKAIYITYSFRLLLIILLFSNFNALAQKTTFWIVRHAEKQPSASDAETPDPQLSYDGRERAVALAKLLKREKIKAIYVTPTKRSAQTVRPLAEQAKILPRVYTDSIKRFANILLKNFNGEKVLIITHSNTAMPLLAALGAETPFETLAEDDYDMVFKVTIKDSGSVELEVSYYGAEHHVSELPLKYQTDKDFRQFAPPMGTVH